MWKPRACGSPRADDFLRFAQAWTPGRGTSCGASSNARSLLLVRLKLI